MTASIIIRSSQAAGLNGSGGRERDKTRAAALPIQRPEDQAHSRFHRGAWRGFGFQRDHHGSASPVWRAVRANIANPLEKTVRHLNSSRPFRRPGAVTFGNARFQACKQSSRRAAYVLHGFNSFRDASASCLQRATGERGNARNPFGEIRNVEC